MIFVKTSSFKRNLGRVPINVFSILSLLLLLFQANRLNAQGVKIGEDGNVAHPSAILEVESTDKGLLMPRLTNAQRGNINNPQPGLQIYNIDTDCVQVYYATGGWQNLKCGCTTFPDATFTGSGGSINSPISFSANGTGAGYSYDWTFPSGTPTTSTQQNPTVEWATAGTYTVELTVTDGDGCSSTETAQIEISLCTPEGPWLFSNAGAIGRLGPTQVQLNTAYSGTNLDGEVTSNSGIQNWTVPDDGTYLIEVAGAQGGGNQGGQGAIVIGEFNLNTGDQLSIVVGQQGEDFANENTSGGGGSYVVFTGGNTNADILAIAGGGGGNPGGLAPSINSIGLISTNGGDGDGGNTPNGQGGTNGDGGEPATTANNRGGGGGGFFTDGGNGTCTTGNQEAGKSFLNGCEGGFSNSCGGDNAVGGFGGGGAGINTGWRGSGAGGGYSGGGGAQTNSVSTVHYAGGGGSFNNGANQNNTAGANTGHGYVTIEKVCP